MRKKAEEIVVKPFHESIIDLIKEASKYEDLVLISHLIHDTKIPKNHDKILAAWNKQRRKLKISRRIAKLGIPALLLAQKETANKKDSEDKKVDIVRLVIEIPGVGKKAEERDYCLIRRHGENDTCPIGGGICRYGITEISPPSRCPMRSGEFLHDVTMTFSIAKRKW